MGLRGARVGAWMVEVHVVQQHEEGLWGPSLDPRLDGFAEGSGLLVPCLGTKLRGIELEALPEGGQAPRHRGAPEGPAVVAVQPQDLG